MNLRKVINRRIRAALDGVRTSGDANVVVSANVGERGTTSVASSRQRVVHRSRQSASADTAAADQVPHNE